VYRLQQFQLEYTRFLATEMRFAMATLDALTASVARQETAEASAIALLNGLAAQIRSMAGDPAAIQALADQIDADTAKLAEAVVTDTPPAPTPPPTPA